VRTTIVIIIKYQYTIVTKATTHNAPMRDKQAA